MNKAELISNVAERTELTKKDAEDFAGTKHKGLPEKVDEKSVMETFQFNGTAYRFCQTNTHTFAVKHEIFNNHIDAFFYGIHDWQMFMKLYFEGVKLYAPLYSFATHLVEGKLALNINWKELADKYLQCINSQ